MTAPQHPSSRTEDEIDLVELFGLLWRKKIVIAAFTVVAALIAALYAFNAGQKWTSVAYISAPRVEQLKAYLEHRRALARIDVNKEVDTAALVKNLFDDFISLSVSKGVKQEFLSTNRYYTDLVAKAGPAQASAILSQIADKQLQIKSPEKNQISPRYVMSFTADNAQTAQQVLTEYIAAVNKRAFDLVDGEFADALAASILSRQAALADIEFKLKNDRAIQVATLQAALSTASKAGLKDYIAGRNNAGNTVIELRDANRLFMLGEKYLSAELATAQEAPLIFPPYYYDLKRELVQLKPLLEHKVDLPYSYSLQLAPTLPTTRQAPKRSLIIALGIVLGGMLGCGWVLVGSAIRGRKSLPSTPLVGHQQA